MNTWKIKSKFTGSWREKSPFIRNVTRIRTTHTNLVLYWKEARVINGKRLAVIENWDRLDSMPSSYQEYCLGGVNRKLSKGAFNQVGKKSNTRPNISSITHTHTHTHTGR